MATSKNFEVKNGLSVGGTERISSAGVGTFTDLNVTGTTTTIDTATLQVQDKNIVINYGSGDTSSTASGAGITIQDAVDASNDATLLWDASADEFDFSHTVTAPSLKSTGAATFDSTFTSTGLLLNANTSLYNQDAAISYYSASNGVYVNGAGTNGWLRLNASGAQNSRTAIDLYGQSGGDYIKIKAANTDTMFIGANAAGRVGIGTSASNANLHVGESNATGDATNPAIQIGGTTTYRLGLYTSTEGAVIENKNGDDGLQFRVKTKGEAMRIDGGTGNVLIGNTSFNAGSFGGNAHGINVAGVQPMALFHETDTDKDGYIGLASSMMFIQTADAIPIRFGTSDEERMRIGSTGKTSWSAGGIGTVATQDRDFTFYTEGSTNGVDIRSNDYRNILLGAGGSSGAAMDAGYIGIYKDGSTKIALNANGTSYIDGGNFGIGTGSTVDTKLHVKDTGGIELRLEADSNNSGQEDCFIRFYTDGKTQEGIAGMDNNNSSTLFSGNTENAMVFGTVSNLPTVFATNNTERMQIDASGNILTGNNPCFLAFEAPATASSGTLVFGGQNHDRGGHYNTSNGRFTAPVAGKYFFTCSMLFNPNNTGNSHYCRLEFMVNGTGSAKYADSLNTAFATDAGSSSTTSDYQSVSMSTIIDLGANDYVQVRNAGTMPTYGTGYGSFAGFLVG